MRDPTDYEMGRFELGGIDISAIKLSRCHRFDRDCRNRKALKVVRIFTSLWLDSGTPCWNDGSTVGFV